MGEKVEIINEHWSRLMLERDNLDYSKFYRRQIEGFLDVSRKDTQKYKELYELEKNKTARAIKRCDELADEIEDLEGSYSYMFLELKNMLEGEDKA